MNKTIMSYNEVVSLVGECSGKILRLKGKLEKIGFNKVETQGRGKKTIFICDGSINHEDIDLLNSKIDKDKLYKVKNLYLDHKSKGLTTTFKEMGEILDIKETTMKRYIKILGLKPLHYGVNKKFNVPTNGYFIYRFRDSKGNILYVGKTTNLNPRILTHFKNGHLPKECYENTSFIEYAICETESDMNIYELYYISKNKPIYNILDKNEVTIKLPELDFKYISKDVIL